MLGHRPPRSAVDETNVVNKNTNLVPRCLSSEGTSDKIDHFLQSDWSMKMAECKSRLVASAIFAPLSKSLLCTLGDESLTKYLPWK